MSQTKSRTLSVVQTSDLNVFEVVLNRAVLDMNERDYSIIVIENNTDVVFTGNIVDCNNVISLDTQGKMVFHVEADEADNEEEIPK